MNKHTLPTWIGKYHRANQEEEKVGEEHLYDELKRLRKENARLKEERDILKTVIVAVNTLPNSTRRLSAIMAL
ncbi:hypothetical protein [Nitrosococcus watsonii]|uniref:hypothetical protein n=1 Tax=Nitrosococcus watsonii TaxID=473531 RepID=UPI0002FD9172|nr:hypothetical protein [Nitrosococcus watsonii]